MDDNGLKAMHVTVVILGSIIILSPHPNRESIADRHVMALFREEAAVALRKASWTLGIPGWEVPEVPYIPKHYKR